MFDAKKLLDQFLGSQVPGTTGTVKEKAGGIAQLAKENPLATGAILAAVLGTKTGRKLAGNVATIGG
ncbi:MAG: tellurite resistance TerB family protein, partial [Rhizobiaceae bacterium]|nr:tellurite resistance TerB family protein [Rhizobiaceae bacterium]